MEIKDYCDIHGEPICVGDTVRVTNDLDDFIVIGRINSIGSRIIKLSMDDESIEFYPNGPETHIEILSKYKKEDSKPDMVNHPPHYQSENGIEVIDVIEAFTADLKGGEATNTGNVIKYILRWPHKKNPLEDLKKARWYIDRLINLVEKRMKKENK